MKQLNATTRTKNTDCDKAVAGFIRRVKICITATVVTGVFGIITLLLTTLKELAWLGAIAPFLYGKTFMWITIAVCAALVAFTIFCYIKARRCKKLIEQCSAEESERSENHE